MKLLLISFLFFAIGWLPAADLQTAEQFFADGDFDRCGRLVEELLQQKLPRKQRTRLVVMREYLLGANPARIAETVRQAKATAAQRHWGTAELLNHAALLIRRAEDWKERGIPEYQELSDAADELLRQARDNGEAETALRIVILQVGNHNLNGEYAEPLKLILEALRLYYPARELRGKPMPDGAIQLFMLAGEQCVGAGVKSNGQRGKANSFTQAAKYFLLAAEALPADDPRFPELCGRLHHCRETLRLLGYQLNLPPDIRPQGAVKIAMVDEMLRHRRFHDAVLALENNPSPAMRIRHAVALSACGELDKAWEIVGAADFSTREPTFLLAIARNFLAAGQKDKAATLLRQFLDAAPDSPDAVSVGRQCAQLLAGLGRGREAADALLKLASAIANAEAAEQLRFTAASCLYQAGNYEECLAVVDALPPDSERMLLAGQAEIRRRNYAAASRRLEPLPKDRGVLKLLIRCGLEIDSPQTADYAETLLRDYPDDSEALEYATHLLGFYEKHPPKAEKFQALGEWTAKNHLKSFEAVILIVKCADRLEGRQKKELLRTLLQRSSFSDSELLSLLARLDDRRLKLEIGGKYAPEFISRPKRCAVFLALARLEHEEGKYLESLHRCKTLLSQPEVWQYKEAKLLQVENLFGLQRHENGRHSCQELLLTNLTAAERRQAVTMLAQSWEQSKEYGKAIAVAWTAVPIDGAVAPEDIPAARSLLQLIIRNAEKINSTVDKNEAWEILEILEARPAPPEL